MSQKQNDNKKQTKKDSTLYYFYSVGCGWCKKVDPLVEELNGDGYDILRLDVSDPTNMQISKELKEKYKVQCGTPWFVDAETGNNFCGFREKDLIEKWAKGEEIPQPVRPTGPPPKVPLMGASKKEEEEWTKEYKKWLENNSKLPNVKTVEEILEMPRPKTDPPPPPTPDASDEDLNKWAVGYDKWKDENDHLPNLIPSNQIIERFQQMKANKPGGTLANPDGVPPNQMDTRNLVARMTVMESKLDRLMNHLGVTTNNSPPNNRIMNTPPAGQNQKPPIGQHPTEQRKVGKVPNKVKAKPAKQVTGKNVKAESN